MFADWTRSELLQLGGIATAAIATVTAALLGGLVIKKVTEIHILINSRLSQMLAGAEAQGQVKERDAADARAQDT